MSQITTAKIVEYDGCNMLIIPQEPISREMIRKQVKTLNYGYAMVGNVRLNNEEKYLQ